MNAQGMIHCLLKHMDMMRFSGRTILCPTWLECQELPAAPLLVSKSRRHWPGIIIYHGAILHNRLFAGQGHVTLSIIKIDGGTKWFPEMIRT